MKKIISFVFLVFVLNLTCFSQQDPQYTNHMFYKLGANPGYAGAEKAINGIILNRYQWEGFEGAPKTLVFSMDAAIKAFGVPGGIGINVINDQLGYYKNTTVNLSYSYKVTTDKGILGIGLSTGVFNAGINPDGWDPSDDVRNSTDSGGDGGGDVLIPQAEASQVVADLGFGLYLSSNHYYLGASVTHINQASIKYVDVENEYLSRHYYLMGGYNIKLADPLFEVRPSMLFKTDLAGWQLDLNTNVVYNERFWGGITYRVNDAVALLMGMELASGIKVGYSFDLVTSAVSRYGYGSHEIFVSYSIDLEKNRSQKYKSIRFL